MNTYPDLFEERYGTSVIADSAFRAGVPVEIPSSGLRPLDVRAKLAGPAMTVEANNDLVSVLEAVHRASPGDAIVIANATPDVGLMGDLIGTEAVRKGLAGFVVDGLVRDTVELIDLEVPVWCRGAFPVGPLKVAKADRGIGIVNGTVTVGGASVSAGRWMFGDADGVVILDPGDLASVFAAAAVAAEREADLAREVASGTPLGEAFRLDAFLAERARDARADFNAHLTSIGRAI